MNDTLCGCPEQKATLDVVIVGGIARLRGKVCKAHRAEIMLECPNHWTVLEVIDGVEQ